jgi:hypothetical protein
MTIEVTPDKVYFAMCFILLVLQVVQYAMLVKTKKEVEEVWGQLGIIITTIGAKIKEIEAKIEQNEKNK